MKQTNRVLAISLIIPLYHFCNASQREAPVLSTACEPGILAQRAALQQVYKDKARHMRSAKTAASSKGPYNVDLENLNDDFEKKAEWKVSLARIIPGLRADTSPLASTKIEAIAKFLLAKLAQGILSANNVDDREIAQEMARYLKLKANYKIMQQAGISELYARLAAIAGTNDKENAPASPKKRRAHPDTADKPLSPIKQNRQRPTVRRQPAGSIAAAQNLIGHTIVPKEAVAQKKAAAIPKKIDELGPVVSGPILKKLLLVRLNSVHFRPSLKVARQSCLHYHHYRRR